MVCSGLRDEAPDEALFKVLDNTGWEKIYKMACRQTVTGICCTAFCKLPDGLLPPHTLLVQWMARVNTIEYLNRCMREAIMLLIKRFRKQGLHPIVQKGLSTARFYQNPDLRESGDIDIWLPGKDFDKGVKHVRESGEDVKHNPDGSFSFVYRGFVVELHLYLIKICNPAVAYKWNTYAIQLCTAEMGNDEEIPSPPPLFEILLISMHIMHHAFGAGIGLRHICDYYCALQALHGKYDLAAFEKACRSLGISKWTEMLNGFTAFYLDAPESILPPSGLKSPKKVSPEALLYIIKEGGNFGQHFQDDGKRTILSYKGKLHTLSMFLKRSRFAASIAPVEAFWGFGRLLLGQMYR